MYGYVYTNDDMYDVFVHLRAVSVGVFCIIWFSYISTSLWVVTLGIIPGLFILGVFQLAM